MVFLDSEKQNDPLRRLSTVERMLSEIKLLLRASALLKRLHHLSSLKLPGFWLGGNSLNVRGFSRRWNGSELHVMRDAFYGVYIGQLRIR